MTNKTKFRFYKILCLSLLLLSGFFTATSLSAEGKQVSLAVFPLENLNRDPDQEYLSGIISSLIREGLSQSEDVFLVDRQNIEEVMKEQRLQFTGVVDEETAVKTGRMVGASYIIKGGYVFLGEDLFLNIDLIDTETARSLSFSERGYQENTVHALTEKLILHLTDEEIELRSIQGERSIIAVRQQTPGKVLVYSHIIDAKIYIDGKFVAYTSGKSTVPVELTLDPGPHFVRTHLDNDFGIIHEPEISFSDWIVEIDLKPGESLVLEDKTVLINTKLYNLSQQLWERITINPNQEDEKSADHSVSFLDRESREIKLDLNLSMKKQSDGSGKAVAILNYQGKLESHEIVCMPGEEKEIEIELEKVDIDVELNCRYGTRWDLSYRVWRNDIWQGLHREESRIKPWDGSEE